jgi:hypothetical protein
MTIISLAEDDVPADVAGLGAQVGLADFDGLRRIACLSQLIGEGSEVAARVVLELAAQFLETSVRHALPSEFASPSRGRGWAHRKSSYQTTDARQK